MQVKWDIAVNASNIEKRFLVGFKVAQKIPNRFNIVFFHLHLSNLQIIDTNKLFIQKIFQFFQKNFVYFENIIYFQMGSCAGSQLLQNKRELQYIQKADQTPLTDLPAKKSNHSLQTQPYSRQKNEEVRQLTNQEQTPTYKDSTKRGKEQHSNYKSFAILIFEIQKELHVNEQLYGQFLDVSIIIEILQYFSKLYINHESAAEIINIVLDFMTYCRNKFNTQSQSQLLKTNFSAQYLNQLSQRWIKVREAVYFFNKDHLKLLNYIVPEPQSQKMEFSHCFTQLKFDLSIDQVREVANVVKKMCQIDVRAFAYLSNYLYSSCINKQKIDKMPISKIQYEYLQILEFLSSENPPAPPIQASQHEFDIHQSIKCPHLIPKCEIDLTKYQTQEEKQFALEAFIMSKASQSMLQFDQFNLILKQICLKNDGYRFKSSVKIKTKNQKNAMTRIKQKMLANIYNEIQLEKRLTSSIRDEYIRNFIDIFSFTKQEYAEFQEKMKKIFNRMNKPVQFKVSDMLRGKCVFSSIQKINKCCEDIKAFVKERENQGFRIIEVDNRLKKENSDLVVKILFGGIIGELQLVKDLNTAEYEFSHKLYELHRSKFFTPLTQLSIVNENISKDYFLEVKALILANSMKKGYTYQQKITYEQPLANFKQFFSKLSIKINFFETHSSEIDIKMMKYQQERFKKLIEIQVNHQTADTKSYEVSLNNGIYFLEMKEYSKSIKELQSSSEQFERLFSTLLQAVKKGATIHHDGKSKLEKYIKIHLYWGRTCEETGNYDEAHKHYQLQLGIKEKIKGKYHIGVATSLNNIGNVYQLQGNYPKALEYYEKCLQIKERVKGKDNIGIATTLNNIGQVYRSQSNFANALVYYEKCLKLQQAIKGKDSIEIATTLNNIGLVYKNQGDYQKALEYYERCLYIKERIKGKDSIGIATTLNNIGNVHQLQANYEQALSYYQKCLQIQQKVKGKDSISIATTLNNIGLVCDAQNNYPKALEYYEKCLEINQKAKGKDNVDTAPTLNNIGECFKNQADYVQALEYYSQAIRIYKKHSVKYRGLANSLSNQGYAHYKLKEFAAAIESFEESLQTYDKISMSDEVKTCAQYIAKCYKGMSETIKMREFISRFQLKFWEI